MPQLRQDHMTQEWVFVANESPISIQELIAQRPPQPRPAFDPICPLCLDKDRLATEVPRLPAPGKSAFWAVRVIPHRLNTLSVNPGVEHSSRCSHSEAEDFGMQETIVETPDHSLSTALLPGTQLAAVLRTAKSRYDELSLDPRLVHVTLGKQQGAEAGAPTEHAHWQLTARRTVPSQVSSWLQHARRHFGRSGACVACTVLHQELQVQTRIVVAGEHFIALEPYASPSPFCTHIYPRRHMANFGEASNAEIGDFAAIVHEVLARFYYGPADPDFTCTLRNAPVADKGAKFYHWCLSVVPCLEKAGEAPRANERFVNPLLPEAAAEFLRAVRIEQAIPA